MIKIYLESLENRLGRWLKLPMSNEDFDTIVQKIVGNGDYIISDYNAPFKISEYENLQKLNEFARRLSELDEEPYIIAAVLKASDFYSINEHGEEILDVLENRDYSIHEGVVDFKDLADKIFEDDPTQLPIFDTYKGESQHLIDWIDSNWGFVDWSEIGRCLNETAGWEFVKVYNEGETHYLAVNVR